MARIRSIVAALAVGVVAAALVPAVAQAADPPVVNWAHSDFDNDYGTLLVSATAASGVTALTAHILTNDTHQEVATANAFTLRSGTAADGVWASAPILLDNLGVYLVDVEVTDADGQHVRQDGIGTLFYAEVTFFENVRLNRTNTTYDKRTVTLRGTLKGRRPGSGVIEPIGGAMVDVLATLNFTSLTTKADGTFAGEVEIVFASEDVWADYGLTQPMHVRTQSEPITVTVQPRPVHVTAAVDRTKVNRGEMVTVTGQATWKVNGAFVPLAGVNVLVGRCGSADPASCFGDAVVVTDADGRYSYSTAPIDTAHFGAIYAAYTDGGELDPYVAVGRGITRLITVLQPSAFTTFNADRDAEGLIAIHGYFDFTGGWSPAHFDLKFQYSTNGVDGWHTFTTLTDARSFDLTGVNIPGAIYVRALYPGDTGFQRTVSEVVAIPAS